MWTITCLINKYNMRSVSDWYFVLFSNCLLRPQPDFVWWLLSSSVLLSATVRTIDNITFCGTVMHIKLHIQVNPNFDEFTLTFPRLVDVLSNVIHSTFFYVLLQNIYHISISPIAWVSLKMGVHRAKTMSLRLKWPNISIFYMRNILKNIPDHYYKQNVEGYTVKKIKVDQIQIGPILGHYLFDMRNKHTFC